MWLYNLEIKKKNFPQTLFYEMTGSSTLKVTITQGFSQIHNCIILNIVKLKKQNP